MNDEASDCPYIVQESEGGYGLSPKASKNLNSREGQKVHVYTLTFQFSRNYGANLQAYALQEFLERSGCEAQIVDYWPAYAESKFRWNSVFTRNPSVGSLLLILKIYRLNRVIEAFKRKHFKLTKKCRSIEYIKALPQPDVYFVGSDQVWNNQILGEYNQAYLLDFDTTALKASYAASAGKDHFSSEELDMLVQYAKRLDYVSVREDSFRDMLKAHGLADVMDHIDPVFLLDREDYRSISRCRKDGQY
ncbi:MAG: polysaccharide pyruvyl transferase family protein, partial [Atopobiaceae bacterium]|nr:polysaccharide pyruvyl transferase family protein [Atopobiaceae bacterium]